jgi:predicted PurR-regulated permease PerM
MSTEAQEIQKEREPNRTLARWQPRLIVTLTILGWLVLGVLLWWLLGHIIGPIIMVSIAILLAYALYPLVKVLQRILPRTLAILGVYLILFALICALIIAVARTALNQVDDLIRALRQLLIAQEAGQPTQLEQLLSNVGITKDQLRTATEQLVNQLSGLVRSIGPVLSQVFGTFLDVLLVIVLSIYALFTGPRVINWLRHKTPRQQRKHVNATLDTLKRVVGGYIRGQLLLSSILSTITGIAMALIGVPYALFIGVLAFLLSFIPTIGAFTTGVICILLALTVSWTAALLAVAFLLFLQLLETQILSPRILGPAVGLHPMVALIALVTGSQLFGLVGALFASLIAGVLQALFLALWSAWKTEHPEQFQDDDDTRFNQAVAREESRKSLARE